MNTNKTHYSIAQNPSEMVARVATMAEYLKDWMAKAGLLPSDVALAYQGMSGIAFATAVAMELYRVYALEVGMIYVRNDGESSHCVRVEYAHGREMPNHVVFVDDFIATGATFKSVKSEVESTFSYWKFKWHQLVSVSGGSIAGSLRHGSVPHNPYL